MMSQSNLAWVFFLNILEEINVACYLIGFLCSLKTNQISGSKFFYDVCQERSYINIGKKRLSKLMTILKLKK